MFSTYRKQNMLKKKYEVVTDLRNHHTLKEREIVVLVILTQLVRGECIIHAKFGVRTPATTTKKKLQKTNNIIPIIFIL